MVLVTLNMKVIGVLYFIHVVALMFQLRYLTITNCMAFDLLVTLNCTPIS